MTLKQVIKEKEFKLKTYNDFVDTIEMLAENKDDKKTLDFLLKMQKLELDSRIMNIESQLVKDRKDRLIEMEHQSQECNFRIEDVVKEAGTWIGKDPKGVTDKLPVLIGKFKDHDGWMNMSQEDRNDVYMELKSHLNFLKNTYKS